MTPRKPDVAPIPLTDDLGDTRALLAPERDPVTGNHVSAAAQRAAKNVAPAPIARPRVTAPPAPSPHRRGRWALPVLAGVAIVVVAFAVTRHHAPRASFTVAPPPATTTAPATTTTTAVVAPIGPLEGYDGTYQLSVENVHISGASGGFVGGRLEQAGTTVTARYDDASGGGSATVELPNGTATITCSADGWTCPVQWTGPFPISIDGSLGRAVLQRADGTPLGRTECNLPIPSDGSLTPKFGLAEERPQVLSFRLSTGIATGSGGGCDNAVVIGYDLVVTRTS